MQNLKIRDFVLPGVIAGGAIVAMVLDARADNGGAAMMIYGAALGLLLLWLAKD